MHTPIDFLTWFFFCSCSFCRLFVHFHHSSFCLNALMLCAQLAGHVCSFFVLSVFLPCYRSCCNQLTLYRLNKYRKQAGKKRRGRGCMGYGLTWHFCALVFARRCWMVFSQLTQVRLLLCTAVLWGVLWCGAVGALSALHTYRHLCDALCCWPELQAVLIRVRFGLQKCKRLRPQISRARLDFTSDSRLFMH